MNRATINYTFGIAQIWGDFTEETAINFFGRLANQCFGIRKSWTDPKVVNIETCDGLPGFWGTVDGATAMLQHSGGDTIVWGADGEKIKTEFD
jgi:hypothetical protein